MKKKLLLSVCLTLVLVMSLVAACTEPAPAPVPAPAPTPAPAPKPEPIVLKMLTFLPPTHVVIAHNVPMFVDRVNKRAKGELVIDWLGGPEVIPMFDQGDAVKAGVVDMLPYYPFAFMSGILPEGNAAGLTQLAAWEEREVGVYDLWDEIVQKRINCKYLGRMDTSPLSGMWMYTNFKVERIEDFEGKIIRVMPLYIPFVEALGASAITMPSAEIYTAMERGVVDGYIYTMGMTGFGLEEVTKYRIDHRIFANDPAAVINLDIWNKIPKHLQDMMLEVMADMEYISVADMVLTQELETEVMVAAGVEFITLPVDYAKRYCDLAYDATWEAVIKDLPEYGPKLRELTTRK